MSKCSRVCGMRRRLVQLRQWRLKVNTASPASIYLIKRSWPGNINIEIGIARTLISKSRSIVLCQWRFSSWHGSAIDAGQSLYERAVHHDRYVRRCR